MLISSAHKRDVADAMVVAINHLALDNARQYIGCIVPAIGCKEPSIGGQMLV